MLNSIAFTSFLLNLAVVSAEPPSVDRCEPVQAADEDLHEILFSDPASALSTLRAIPACASAERDLFSAYAQYKADGESSKSAGRLTRAIKNYRLASGSETYAFGRILTEQAARELQDMRLKEAVETAEDAERILHARRPDDVHAIARVVVWAGVAKLYQSGSAENTTKAAAKDFDRARAILELPLRGTNTDPLLAEAIAWQAAAAGQFATESKSIEEAESFGIAFRLTGADSCAGVWTAKASHKVRVKLSWAANLVYLTAPFGAVVAVDADADGKAVNMRVIGEARRPSSARIDREKNLARDHELPRALRRWLATSEGAAPECLKDHLIVFSGYDYPVKKERIDFNSQTNVGFHN